MKRVLFIVMFMTALFQGFSQTRGISYQAVILSPDAEEIPGKDSQGNILANTTVSIQFTFVDASGSEEFQEYHTTSTDRYGMINLLIGSGTATSSNDFTDIAWDGTIKKLKVMIDFSGGSNFSSLSEQNLSYMPHPVSQETTQLINDNFAINASDITTNTTAIATNASDITTNTTAIASNAASILLKEDVFNKSTNVATDAASDIKYPSVKAIKTYVDATLIDGSPATLSNTTNITTNTTAIATNASDITTNTTAIATNASDITTNTTAIAINASDITTNTTAIATNASDITTNTTAIASNAASILLKEDVFNKSTNVATDAASDIKYPSVKAIKTYVDATLIDGSPATLSNTTNITTNTTAIATNASDITTNTTAIAINASNITTTHNCLLQPMLATLLQTQLLLQATPHQFY